MKRSQKLMAKLTGRYIKILQLQLLNVNSTIDINGTYLLAMSQSLTQMLTVNRPLTFCAHIVAKHTPDLG